MTPVNIHLITADGQPMANTAVQILLPKAGVDMSGTEIALPKKLSLSTDAEGKVTVDLYPVLQHPYTLIAADWKTGAKIREHFYVPESDDPVELRDIIQLPAPTPMPYDEAAIQSITQDRVWAQESEVDAQAAQAAAEVAQSLSEEAQTASETARNASQAAQALSETARNQSQTAQAASELARDQSQTAQGLSETAQAASELAQNRSEQAQAASETAQGLAEAARNAAQTAQGLSEQARDDSQLARDASQTAQGLSETAQAAGEAAQAASEAARNASQAAQAASEAARDASQVAQGLSEAAQAASEVARDQSQAAQALSETAQTASETAQGLSETAQVASEAAQDGAETAQGLSEAAQASSEAARDLTLQYRNTASSHNDAAAESASAAAVSEANASASEDAAAASEANAAASEAASAGNEGKAEQWANADRNIEVEPGKYSAKHWKEETAELMLGILVYRGLWNASTQTFPADPAQGDYYKVGTSGTIGGIDFLVGDHVVFNGSAWDHIDNTEKVVSVGGYSGAITAGQLLNALQEVDGEGSGLDAGLLGGMTLGALTANYQAYADQAKADAKDYADGVTAPKLDSATYTAIDVLNKLITVDGVGSGLDADLLDGQHASAFAAVSHSHAWADITDQPATATRWPVWGEVTGKPSSFTPSSHSHAFTELSDSGEFSIAGEEFKGRGKRALVATTTNLVLNHSADFTKVTVQSDLEATGDVTAYASDARLKENIEAIEDALDKVGLLRGVTYDWIPECGALGFRPSNPHEHGVIAQEVAKVVPDAVSAAPFDNNYLTVKYDRLVPLLIEAVKEEKTKREGLERRVRKLEELYGAC